MASNLQIPQLRAAPPKITLLRRPVVWLVIAVILVGIGLVFVWDARSGRSQAEVPAVTRTGLGRTGLEGAVDGAEDKPADKQPGPAPAKPVKVEPRGRKVLGNSNAFKDPNIEIAAAEIETWKPAQAAQEPQEGCVLADGTVFYTLRAGGLLRTSRPVYGHDSGTGETCTALPAGSSVSIVQDEQGTLSAISIQPAGQQAPQTVEWPVHVGAGEGRARVYDVRVTGDTVLSGSNGK